MPHRIIYLHKALKMSIFTIYSHSSALTWQLRPKSLFNLYSNLCSISLAQLQYQHQLQDYYLFWQHFWCQSEMFIELFPFSSPSLTKHMQIHEWDTDWSCQWTNFSQAGFKEPWSAWQINRNTAELKPDWGNTAVIFGPEKDDMKVNVWIFPQK